MMLWLKPSSGAAAVLCKNSQCLVQHCVTQTHHLHHLTVKSLSPSSAISKINLHIRLPSQAKFISYISSEKFTSQCWTKQTATAVKTGHSYTGVRKAHTHSAAVKEDVTLENIFSDWNRHRVQEQLDMVKPVRTAKMMGVKRETTRAAVLVPLCVVDGEPSVLFTLRSSSLKQHRGEVSFPGGNQDEADTDVTHTALRETFEEIGLNPRHFDIWGTLTPSMSNKQASRFVYPVIARYKQNLDFSTLRLNADEVEEVFTCPVQDLCEGGKIRVGSTQYRTGPGYTLPVYVGGPHRVWGLSAVILHQVLTLLAPNLYTYKLRHVA